MDADDRLGELLEQLNQSGLRPDAIVFTGDLADKGEPAAYRKLRGLVEPFAAQLGAELVWVMVTTTTGPNYANSCWTKRHRWRR